MSGTLKLMLRMQGGFCNRLRAIVSGVLWAEDLNCQLHISWPVEPGHMACAFEELIDPTSIPRLSSVRQGYLTNTHQIISSNDMELVVKMINNNEIRIQSYSEFHPDVRMSRGLSILRGIRIVADLEHQAEMEWQLLKGKPEWLGVHFRGTDHQKCLKASPLTRFFEQLGASPSNMLLITDETHIKEEFFNRYGKETVSTTNLELGRRTSKQQRAGVIEWLLLQKCGSIIGSLGSSYSELAALRSGCRYEAVVIPEV